MYKLNALFITFFGIIALTSSFGIRPNQNGDSDIGFVVVDSIQDLIKTNPDLVFIPLYKESQLLKGRTFGQKESIRYSMGTRSPSDRLLASVQHDFRYPTLQDVTMIPIYPQSGTGAIVSYIEILVEQSSNIGQAYIVEGGIFQRFVRVAVEAKQTQYFKFKTEFYGYD